MMSSNVSGALRRKIFKRDKYTCQVCGIVGFEVRSKSKWSGATNYSHYTQKKGVYLSIDHILPRFMGGSSIDEKNLRCLCTLCNCRRRDYEQV